jgi:hypothetical protein
MFNTNEESTMSQLDNYIAKLKAHDWFYMYADSLREFQRGKDQWLAIAGMQPQLDPDYAIFNQHAPEGMKIDPAKRKGGGK